MRKQVKTVMDHLNKGYNWKTNNAAVLVSLYDQLKKQNKELLNSYIGECIKCHIHTPQFLSLTAP